MVGVRRQKCIICAGTDEIPYRSALKSREFKISARSVQRDFYESRLDSNFLESDMFLPLKSDFLEYFGSERT